MGETQTNPSPSPGLIQGNAPLHKLYHPTQNTRPHRNQTQPVRPLHQRRQLILAEVRKSNLSIYATITCPPSPEGTRSKPIYQGQEAALTLNRLVKKKKNKQ